MAASADLVDPVGAGDEEDGAGVVDVLCRLPYRIVSFCSKPPNRRYAICGTVSLIARIYRRINSCTVLSARHGFTPLTRRLAYELKSRIGSD